MRDSEEARVCFLVVLTNVLCLWQLAGFVYVSRSTRSYEGAQLYGDSRRARHTVCMT